MMKVCVLLSTYNGEKFLVEQLESLKAQQGCDVDIWVRDDGSSDNTCQILNEWKERGALNWYSGPNLGYAMSFLELMSTAGDYDYYAFCDQDDIWLKDKLSRAVEQLERIDARIKLYCSNVFFYKDGIVGGGIHKTRPEFDKYTSLVRNIAPGCSMVFDKSLRDLVIKGNPERIIAHDFWIFQLAALFGTVCYDFEPSMLYRQHANNQIGQKTSRLDIWKRRFKSMNSSEKNAREAQAKELLRCFGNIIPDDSRRVVEMVADYRLNLIKRFRLLFEPRVKMNTFSNSFFLKLHILFSTL